METLFKFFSVFRYPELINRAGEKEGFCFACGKQSKFQYGEVITSELEKTWGLSPKEKNTFNLRESMWCLNCGNSYRTRKLAKTLVKLYGKNRERSLEALIGSSSFRKLQIAEINSCGNLHFFLGKLPKLFYSEFKVINGEKSVRQENLENLTYKDNFFDLVITSETLEHVPNLNKALEEIQRVLKPGGKHVFTIPVIISRRMRERIVQIEDKQLKKKLPDSFHGSGDDYLVFREFGGDVVDYLANLKFTTSLYFLNLLSDDFSYVFVSEKQKGVI